MIRNGIAKVGFDGEWKALEVIKQVFNTDGSAMQVDWIFRTGSSYYVVEVKHQEYYKAPPFNGHGLPKWQVEARLGFYKDTGIRPILLIIEKPLAGVYVQYLDVLNSSNDNYFDTKGNSPRRIYRLDLFEDKTDICRSKGLI